MQTDPTTYCSDPDGVPEFKEWMESFNVENFKGEISELLVVNTDVRALYTKLVRSLYKVLYWCSRWCRVVYTKLAIGPYTKLVRTFYKVLYLLFLVVSSSLYQTGNWTVTYIM